MHPLRFPHKRGPWGKHCIWWIKRKRGEKTRPANWARASLSFGGPLLWLHQKDQNFSQGKSKVFPIIIRSFTSSRVGQLKWRFRIYFVPSLAGYEWRWTHIQHQRQDSYYQCQTRLEWRNKNNISKWGRSGELLMQAFPNNQGYEFSHIQFNIDRCKKHPFVCCSFLFISCISMFSGS